MSERDERAERVEITRMSLRNGGWIGYSEDAVFVDRGDDERVKIQNEAIQRISVRTLSWDVAVMSVLLVGSGAYVATTRNPLVGVRFAALGAFSLYRTYSKRYALVVRVQNRRKPIAVHPEHPKECLQTLADRVGLE